MQRMQNCSSRIGTVSPEVCNKDKQNVTFRAVAINADQRGLLLP